MTTPSRATPPAAALIALACFPARGPLAPETPITPPPGSGTPGKKVRLPTWAFPSRTPVGTPLNSGSTHTLTLRPFGLGCSVDPGLESVQQLDETNPVLEPTYWFDPFSPPTLSG